MQRIFNWIVSVSAFVISLAYTAVLFTETKRLSSFQGNFAYLHLLLSSLLVLVFAGYFVYFIRNDRLTVVISRIAVVLFMILQIYKVSLQSINTEDLIIYSMSFCMLVALSLSTQNYFKLPTIKSAV